MGSCGGEIDRNQSETLEFLLISNFFLGKKVFGSRAITGYDVLVLLLIEPVAGYWLRKEELGQQP